MLESVFIAIIASLMVVFYRNCLKGHNMIFNKIYFEYLYKWAKGDNKFLAWIAFPLGYCPYCNGPYVSMIIYFLARTEPITFLNIITVLAIQHFLIVIIIKYFIDGNPDMQMTVEEYWEKKNRLKGINNG